MGPYQGLCLESGLRGSRACQSLNVIRPIVFPKEKLKVCQRENKSLEEEMSVPKWTSQSLG